MIGPKTIAKDGSIAVGGANHGTLVNVNAAPGAQVNVEISPKIRRQLPSYLGGIVAKFAEENLSSYGKGARREVTAEVAEKLTFNNIALSSRLINEYTRYEYSLERAYTGVEQQNSDARFLVRRRAATVYQSALLRICDEKNIAFVDRGTFARNHPEHMIDMVIGQLLDDYSASQSEPVEVETAHFAISLIVADAVIECEVLERPKNVIAA